MVLTPRSMAVVNAVCRPNLVGRMLVAVLVCLGVTSAGAQQPRLHYRHSGDMPPGAIGRAQLQRGRPLPGYFQPVAIMVPEGTRIALTGSGGFEVPQAGPRKAGFLIGQVYRLRVTNIPLELGVEVFPTKNAE